MKDLKIIKTKKISSQDLDTETNGSVAYVLRRHNLFFVITTALVKGNIPTVLFISKNPEIQSWDDVPPTLRSYLDLVFT